MKKNLVKEKIQAVHNLPELMAVDNIDVWFIGTSDLSHSMGIPAQYDNRELLGIVDRTIEQIIAAGRTPGIIARNGDDAKKYLDKGVKYVIVGAAGVIMASARGFLQKAR